MNWTKLGWLPILVVVTVLAAALPVIGIAQDVGVEGEPATINGCIATAQKPDIQQGQVVARAKVECETALAGREIVVELWQKDSNGVFQLIPAATTTWEGADQVQELHKADASGIECQDLGSGNTRRYKTRINISDGSGNFTRTTSLGEELGRNCLADSTMRLSNLPPATETGEVTASGEVNASSTYNEKWLVFCTVRAYNPTWPSPGYRMYARGRFNCSPGINGITYIRTRLLRETDRFVDRYVIEGNRASWFHTDRGTTADVYASCKTASSANRNYWTWTREYVENSRGEYYDSGIVVSQGVVRPLKCV